MTTHWGEDTDVALRLRLYRGNEATIPTLEEGELAYTKDTEKVWIGTKSGNKLLDGVLIFNKESEMPVLSEGALAYAKDTKSIWVGTSTGNVQILSDNSDSVDKLAHHSLVFVIAGTPSAGAQPAIVRLPYNANIIGIYAVCGTAGTTETVIDLESNTQSGIDSSSGWTSILSTKLTIDANEKSSNTAAVASVFSDTSVVSSEHLRINVTSVGTGISDLTVIVEVKELL